MSERLNQNRSGKEGMATGMKKDALISCLARFHELRDGPTDRPTDRPTKGQTRPSIDVRGHRTKLWI